MPAFRQALHLFARVVEHPLPKGQNERRCLDERQEIGRLEQAARGVTPADQRLHPDNQPGHQLDLRLKVEFQFIAFKGLPQIVSKSDSLMRLTVEVVAIEAILVTTFFLRPIESNIGLREHFVGPLYLVACTVKCRCLR